MLAFNKTQGGCNFGNGIVPESELIESGGMFLLAGSEQDGAIYSDSYYASFDYYIGSTPHFTWKMKSGGCSAEREKPGYDAEYINTSPRLLNALIVSAPFPSVSKKTNEFFFSPSHIILSLDSQVRSAALKPNATEDEDISGNPKVCFLSNCKFVFPLRRLTIMVD